MSDWLANLVFFLYFWFNLLIVQCHCFLLLNKGTTQRSSDVSLQYHLSLSFNSKKQFDVFCVTGSLILVVFLHTAVRSDQTQAQAFSLDPWKPNNSTANCFKIPLLWCFAMSYC